MNLRSNAGTSVSSFFKHASHFIVKESTILDVGRDVNVYISGTTQAAKPGHRRCDEGLNDGLEVISLNSLDLKKELRNGGALGYRIHLAQQRQNRKRGYGTVIVKTFEGSRSKKRHAATVAFMRRFFHPNIARLLGVSSCSANIPYIVYQGGVSTCRIQALIAKDLRTKLELGVVSSLRFTKGIAAAISYLQNQGISLQSIVAGGSFENLDVLAGEDGEAVLTMSAGVVDNLPIVPLNSSTMVTSEDGWKLFNDLCQQTLQEVNYILHQDSPHRTPKRDLSHATQSIELNTAELQTTSPLTDLFAGQSKTRREVRWEVDGGCPQPLDVLAQRFQDDIDSCGSLRRLTVPNSWPPVHQCPGYLREEVNICADLSRSAVLTYAAPTPNERCTICGKLVLSFGSHFERDFGQWFTPEDEGEIDFEEDFGRFTPDDGEIDFEENFGQQFTPYDEGEIDFGENFGQQFTPYDEGEIDFEEDLGQQFMPYDEGEIDFEEDFGRRFTSDDEREIDFEEDFGRRFTPDDEREINFEDDFGQQFTPDDAGSPDDVGSLDDEREINLEGDFCQWFDPDDG